MIRHGTARNTTSSVWRWQERFARVQLAIPLVLCEDGRNDSPGYSAQYCTYSLMDASSNQILAMEVVDC